MTTNTKSNLTARILIAMLLGILVGAIFKWLLGGEAEKTLQLAGFSIGLKAFFVDGIFHAGGQIFVASLKMLVVPLVLVSLVCGTSSLKDLSSLGRIGSKSLGLYIATTAIAIALAMLMALLFAPGIGVNMPLEQNYQVAQAPSVVQVFINMFPSNPIDAMAKGEMLQIIIFAVIFGMAIGQSGDAGERIRQWFDDVNVVVMQLVNLVMHLSPYGVFFLMAKLFTTLELADMENLGKYFAVVLFVLLLHGFVSYGLILTLIGRLNPIIFFRKMKETALFAFSTSSSNATIASNMTTTTA